MKRIILYLLVLLLLAGCSNGKKVDEIKKLSCSKTISDDLSEVLYTVNGEYKNNKLNKIESIIKISVNNVDILNEFIEYLNLIKDEYNKYAGINTNLITSDNSLVLNIYFDLKKMNQNGITENNFDKKYEQLIDIYKNDGYTCK